MYTNLRKESCEVNLMPILRRFPEVLAAVGGAGSVDPRAGSDTLF